MSFAIRPFGLFRLLAGIAAFSANLPAAGANARPSDADNAPKAVHAAAASSALDETWHALFRKLSGQGAVQARFVEFRRFPFRKMPVQLKGEMRFSKELGLSLHYSEPEERVVVADGKGLLLRSSDGRTRSMPLDAKRPESGSVLLNILRFEYEALETAFHMKASRIGMAWQVDFVARDERARRTLGTIIVSGEDNTVRKLEFRQSENQRVEIFIEEARHGVVFTTEEIKQFFR